jgi:SpoVK/Ycf46/Vps4 family AAA+-type ATPase
VRVNTKKSSKAVSQSKSSEEEHGSTLLLSGEHASQASAAARAIAAELGKTVRRTSLARVVGKFAGETERNLAKLFARATELDVVLILDDADALFGKRKANERYAHMQMNHLLRMIEGYRGVSVVTAKNDKHLDAVFLGRFVHVRDVPDAPAASRLERKGAKSSAKKSAKAPAKGATKAVAVKATKAPAKAALKAVKPARPVKAAPKPPARATGKARASARRR